MRDDFNKEEARVRKNAARAAAFAQQARSPVHAPTQAILEALRAELDRIDESVDRAWEKWYESGYSLKMPADATNRPTPPATPRRPATPAAVAFDALPVRARHKADLISQTLRHSAGEACFQNLLTFFRLLPEKGGDAAWVEKFRGGLDDLPASARGVRLALDRELTPGVRMGAPFPVAEGRILRGIERLEQSIGRRGEWPLTDAAQRSQLSREGCDALNEVVQGMGALRSQIDAGRADPLPLLRGVVDLFRPDAESRGVGLDLEMPAEGPRLFADAEGLRSAFAEVIRNALKYAFPAPTPGARLRVTARLDTAAPGGALVVEFADNGRGMPPDVLTRLGARGVTTGRSGEGLAAVKSVIEGEHAGRFAVESAPDKGTTVRLWLPVKPADKRQEVVPQ